MAPDGPPRYPSCEGGMTGAMTAENLMHLSATSYLGAPCSGMEARLEGKLKIGTTVAIEATCLDAEGEKLRHTRVEGHVARPAYGGHGGSTYAEPAPEAGEARGAAGQTADGLFVDVRDPIVPPELSAFGGDAGLDPRDAGGLEARADPPEEADARLLEQLRLIERRGRGEGVSSSAATTPRMASSASSSGATSCR